MWHINIKGMITLPRLTIQRGGITLISRGTKRHHGGHLANSNQASGSQLQRPNVSPYQNQQAFVNPHSAPPLANPTNSTTKVWQRARGKA